jgi:hypothetical protein
MESSWATDFRQPGCPPLKAFRRDTNATTLRRWAYCLLIEIKAKPGERVARIKPAFETTTETARAAA